MNYSLERVPTFLLHDGISWCLKTNRPHVRFYRTIDGKREIITATPTMILNEIVRRESELHLEICRKCGRVTDGRSHIHIGEPLCTPCYWEMIQAIYNGTAPPPTPQKPRVIHLPGMVEVPARPVEETPEQIAARLGVSLDVLQENGYFD